MRFIGALLLGLVGLAHCPTARACIAHYRSIESHVKTARTIVELEVVSVAEAPPPQGRRDSPSARKDAQAKIRVLRTLRGENATLNFVVIGGPYSSCNLFPEYLHFKVGQHFFLILPSELPPPKKPVEIVAVGEVFTGPAKEMDRLIESGRRSWQRTFELYWKADSDAYAKAQVLLQKLAEPGTANAVARAPYPVQACMNMLGNDPERTPKRASPAQEFVINGVPLPMPLVQTGTWRRPDIVAFNRRVFEILLTDRFGLSKAEIRSIEDAECVKTQWENPSFNPEKVNFACQERPDLETLSFLQDLDSFEPDGMVFRSFGRSREVDVDGAVVARYVNSAPERDFDRRAVRLLLQIPHLDLARFADKAFAKAEYGDDFVDLFRFFLGIGHFEKAQAALVGLKKALSNDGDRQSRAEMAKVYVKDLEEAMTRNHCKEVNLLESIAEIRRHARR